MSKNLWQGAALAAAVTLAAALGGCGHEKGTLIPNERPSVQLSARPMQQDSVFYSVRLQWFGSDSDGQVTGFIWAVDPPAEGDTAWQAISRSDTTLFFRSTDPDSASIQVPFPPTSVTSRDYHVFVIKARDDLGAYSQPDFVAFTSETVAPATTITDPPPSRIAIAITAPAVIIRWTGQDQDGVLTQRPIKYKFKLVSQSLIQSALGLGSTTPTARNLQDFFSQEAPGFASWDSTPAESTFKQYEGLTPGQIWYFAVSAVDEAGAYEPRFNLDTNLLKFKPDTQLQAPRLTIFNSYFSRSQQTGSFDLSENRVVRLEVPEGDPVPFFWEAQAVQGTVISGYRWCLDIDDVFNETPRENDSQTDRWSSWSLSEQSATVGPFFVEVDNSTEPPTIRDTHRFYVEARDNVGTVSIMIVEARAVPPVFQSVPDSLQRILIFDDTRANTDRTTNGLRPYGVFPTESVLDTLLYAVGGFPLKYTTEPRPISQPGVFVGFPYDTLDYRFTPVAGLPLSTMTQYNAIVWYTQALDAGLTGSKFSASPEGALRFINKAGELNTLAVYVSQGGHTWLFGDGVVQAIANGYVTRFGAGGNSPAFFPYNGQLTGGARPSATSILWPGNFLYDYMKLYSQMDKVDFAGAGDILSSDDELVGMTPYLPEYMTPGAPWPPEGPPPVTDRGPADDPRVGPSSSRHVGRWAGLPQLTFTTEYPDWPTSLPTSIKSVPYISLSNSVTEGSPPVSVLDTLYLYRGKIFRLKAARDWPDGKPVWVHYWGAAHGQVNWTGAPIWMFERTQLQLVADRILGQFGFHRSPDPRTWSGPGTVRVRDDYVAAGR